MTTTRTGSETAAVAYHKEASARDKVACLECVRVEDDWDSAPMIEVDRDLAGWREQAQGWRARATAAETALAAMTERCRVLEEALRPFAAEAKRLEPSGPDQTIGGSCQVWQIGGVERTRSQITYANLRRAAAVLTEGSKP